MSCTQHLFFYLPLLGACSSEGSDFKGTVHAACQQETAHHFCQYCNRVGFLDFLSFIHYVLKKYNKKLFSLFVQIDHYLGLFMKPVGDYPPWFFSGLGPLDAAAMHTELSCDNVRGLCDATRARRQMKCRPAEARRRKFSYMNMGQMTRRHHSKVFLVLPY